MLLNNRDDGRLRSSLGLLQFVVSLLDGLLILVRKRTSSSAVEGEKNDEDDEGQEEDDRHEDDHNVGEVEVADGRSRKNNGVGTENTESLGGQGGGVEGDCASRLSGVDALPLDSFVVLAEATSVDGGGLGVGDHDSGVGWEHVVEVVVDEHVVALALSGIAADEVAVGGGEGDGEAGGLLLESSGAFDAVGDGGVGAIDEGQGDGSAVGRELGGGRALGVGAPASEEVLLLLVGLAVGVVHDDVQKHAVGVQFVGTVVLAVHDAVDGLGGALDVLAHGAGRGADGEGDHLRNLSEVEAHAVGVLRTDEQTVDGLLTKVVVLVVGKVATVGNDLGSDLGLAEQLGHDFV